ncbi:MAG: hypothetical protein AB7O76_18225 [Rhizobiaceae bacterium]
MSSPTYGTGTSADKQLLSDVTGILSISPKDRPRIEYKPRPELVRPADTSVLPPPQTNAVADAAGVWPESPEERRARIRADATANRDNPDFDPEVETVGQGTQGASLARVGERGNFESHPDPAKQREEFNRRLTETKQGSPTTRKFLSEPPLDYREAAASAPVGDVGEDEWKKERRQKRAAKKKGGGLSDLWPF